MSRSTISESKLELECSSERYDKTYRKQCVYVALNFDNS